jgi:hypothetical protein
MQRSTTRTDQRPQTSPDNHPSEPTCDRGTPNYRGKLRMQRGSRGFITSRRADAQTLLRNVLQRPLRGGPARSAGRSEPGQRHPIHELELLGDVERSLRPTSGNEVAYEFPLR